MRVLAVGLVMSLLFAGCASVDDTAERPREPLYNGEPPAEAAERPTRDHDSGDKQAFNLITGANGVGTFHLADTAGLRYSPCTGCTSWYMVYLEPIGSTPPAQAVAVVLVGGEPAASVVWAPGIEHEYTGTDRIDKPVASDMGQRFLRIPAGGLQGDISVIAGIQGGGMGSGIAVYLGTDFDFDGSQASAVHDDARTVPANGTATSFQAHGHYEMTTSLANLPPTIFVTPPVEFYSVGNITLDEAIPGWTNGGGARSMRATAECELDGWGFSRTSMGYLVEDTTYWEHEVQAGQQSLFDNGIQTSVVLYDYVVFALTFGFVDGLAAGNGDGAMATISWSGQMFPLTYAMGLDVVCFDASWTDLTGLPGQGEWISDDAGVVPGIRPPV